MLKKYFKQMLGEFKKEKLHNNFYDTIIDIDWKKINYNRSAFINKALHRFHNGKYLEIGCNNNKCFNSIFAKFKVGVDPNLGGTIRDTSDNFFNNNTMFFDVIFIDGLHTFEQCRKDVMNSLKFLNNKGYIFIHDLIPRSWLEENVPRLQPTWTGDVWKVSIELSKTSGIDFSVILADMGLGLIKKENNNVIYYNNYLNIKNLKYKDFLNRIDEIKFIDADQALNILDNE